MIKRLINYINFLRLATKAYKMARPNCLGYCAYEKFGIPEAIVLVALGRDSWRVSQIAIDAYRRPE